MKLLKSNFEFHDNFYIYEIKDFKDRIFATDLYENSLSIDNLYTYKFENNKYMIDIKTNDNFLIFLNHFFDDNWICIDNTNKKSIDLIKHSQNYLGFNALNLSRVECYYKY